MWKGGRATHMRLDEGRILRSEAVESREALALRVRVVQLANLLKHLLVIVLVEVEGPTPSRMGGASRLALAACGWQ